MRTMLAVSVLVAGCSAPAVPAGAVEIDAEALEVARAAWMAQGLPKPVCAAPVLLVVSAEELTEHVGFVACAAPHEGFCVYAGTDLRGYARPVTFYTPAPGGLAELELLAHETFHVWAACTLGEEDGDYHHARPEIWSGQGAIGFVDDVAGVPHHGYAKIP